MNIFHYVKQGFAWLNQTAIAIFTYRFVALCCALMVYVVLMSAMLTMLFLFAIYQLTIGQLKPKAQGNVYDMEVEHERNSQPFSTHKLPSFPKW